MKTCKTGCGKMQAGGSVKKVKKMANGGSTGLVGMPRYSNNPRSEQGRILKKGGSASSNPCPKGYHLDENGICTANMFRTLGSKLGVGTVIAGAAGMGIKKIADKMKEKKAAKEAEKKKKEAATPKGKFGMSVAVKSSCKQGMVRGADGNCVMSRPKFQKGGSLKPVNKSANPGLAKLPTAVRNNMGYMKKGGVKKR